MLQDGVEGVSGRVARFVDQLVGQHRMGSFGDPVGIAGRGVDLHTDKTVPELLGQAGKAFGWCHAVLTESKAEDAHAVAVTSSNSVPNDL